MTDKEKADQEAANQSKKFKLIVDGQPVEVSETELIALGQQGKHYTQEMQKLREREKGMSAESERKAQELFDGWLKEIAETAETPEASAAPESSESIPPALAKELKAMREMVDGLKQQQSKQGNDSLAREMNTIMQGLKTKYPHMNRRDLEDRFLKEATDKDNPAELFDKFAKDSEDSYAKDRQAIIDDYVKSKSQPPGEGGETGGSGGAGSTTDKVEPPKDFDEAGDRAKKFIEATRGTAPLI